VKEANELPAADCTRREFCIRTGQAVSLATLAAMLQACGSPTSPSASGSPLPIANASLAGGSVVLTVDSSSPLAAVGAMVLVQSSAGDFLVTRTSSSSFIAVTALCTHQGCTVNRFDNQIFVCPCHGSRYNTSGMVVTGPATQSLRQFSTQFADNVLTIAV